MLENQSICYKELITVDKISVYAAILSSVKLTEVKLC